jgi:hypothetical protein
MLALTALFAACTVFAAVAMEMGNPTAASGVIGAGICTVACGACAWLGRA